MFLSKLKVFETAFFTQGEKTQAQRSNFSSINLTKYFPQIDWKSSKFKFSLEIIENLKDCSKNPNDFYQKSRIFTALKQKAQFLAFLKSAPVWKMTIKKKADLNLIEIEI